MLICGSCFRFSSPKRKIEMLTTPQKAISGGGWNRCPACRTPLTTFDDTYVDNVIPILRSKVESS